MSTITPHYRTVKELLQSQSFSIDEYQREYKWEEKNIVELISDLQEKFLSCYQAGDTTQKLAPMRVTSLARSLLASEMARATL
jgi:hypothetical protein